MSIFNDLRNSPLNQKEMEAMANRIQDFAKTIKGAPQQQVQQLLNSGKISNAQYQAAVKMTNRIYQFMNMMR